MPSLSLRRLKINEMQQVKHSFTGNIYMNNNTQSLENICKAAVECRILSDLSQSV